MDSFKNKKNRNYVIEAIRKKNIEMEKEKLIYWKTAIRRVPADQLDQVLAPVFDRKAVKAAKCIAHGLPAGPGAASGKLYLNAERAVEAAGKGEKVLLVRNETSPEDLRGMIAAEGILTAKGGVSSHAALVARQMGKVCVCGAADLQIDYGAKTVSVNGSVFNEGDALSIDGTAAGKTTPSELELTYAQIARKSVHVVLRKSGFHPVDRTIDFSRFSGGYSIIDGDTRMTARMDEELSPVSITAPGRQLHQPLTPAVTPPPRRPAR